MIILCGQFDNEVSNAKLIIFWISYLNNVIYDNYLTTV